MKKDWLKDIHDRMADFETDAPQGLWENICAAESAKAYNKWIWSAAAAACLLIGWYFYPAVEQEVKGSEEQVIAVADHHDPIIDQSDDQSDEQSEKKQAETVEVISSSIMTKSSETIAHTSIQEINEPQEKADSIPMAISSAKKEPEAKNNYQHLAQTDTNRDAELSRKQRERKQRERHQQDQRLTIALSSSGGMSSNSRQLYQGGYAIASTTDTDAEWQDRPLLGIMYLNRGAETERKVSHHAPIRTDLSFTYQINDRWSLESGVTYAMVTSDIHEGSVANYIDEHQKLHYVGVPLGVSYRAYSWKNLDLYLSSDVLAEQNVSGQTTRNYILGDHSQQEEVFPIKSRPLQISIGAKAGVQYNLNSVLSVYAEPGCRYYFDDQSSLETVFKDRKLDFNLNLGVRFTVGK